MVGSVHWGQLGRGLPLPVGGTVERFFSSKESSSPHPQSEADIGAVVSGVPVPRATVRLASLLGHSRCLWRSPPEVQELLWEERGLRSQRWGVGEDSGRGLWPSLSPTSSVCPSASPSREDCAPGSPLTGPAVRGPRARGAALRGGPCRVPGALVQRWAGGGGIRHVAAGSRGACAHPDAAPCPA